MQIHHIFIFSDEKQAGADPLVEFGLTEGSNRIHLGQGTANRKFYFENFFLEVLWVHNEQELRSELIKPTGLSQRADFNSNGVSPFGVCLVNEAETDPLFEPAIKYQPEYFPPGLAIDILRNERNPTLPWTFRLPFKGATKPEGEPIEHRNGISLLTKAVFEHQAEMNEYLDPFHHETSIGFRKASRTWLNLEFDNRRQGLTRDFEKLKLTIEY